MVRGIVVKFVALIPGAGGFAETWDSAAEAGSLRGPESRSYAPAGKSLAFGPAARRAGCRGCREAAKLRRTFDENKRSEALAKKRADLDNTGADEVTSIAYLPQAFTTLFFIAASLLLGLMR